MFPTAHIPSPPSPKAVLHEATGVRRRSTALNHGSFARRLLHVFCTVSFYIHNVSSYSSELSHLLICSGRSRYETGHGFGSPSGPKIALLALFLVRCTAFSLLDSTKRRAVELCCIRLHPGLSTSLCRGLSSGLPVICKPYQSCRPCVCTASFSHHGLPLLSLRIVAKSNDPDTATASHVLQRSSLYWDVSVYGMRENPSFSSLV